MPRLIILFAFSMLYSSDVYARRGGSSDGSALLNIIVIGVIIFIIVYFYSEKSNKARIEAEHIRKKYDDQRALEIEKNKFLYNQQLETNRLLKEKEVLESFIAQADKRIELDTDIAGNKKSRKWFAEMKAEFESALDEYKARLLEIKKHASKKGAETLREVKAEKRELVKKLKYAEYQLKTYEEYFPIIEDIKDYLLEEDFTFISGDADGNTSQIDPVQRYLTPDEYKKLPTDIKNQTALNNYLSKKHSKIEIGRFYERYLGYLYESDGWDVKYVGIIEGFEDLGRDLVCSKKNKIEIVQAKNWSKFRTIREKHLYQLYATTIHYRIQNEVKKNVEIQPVFCSTIDLSDMAKKVAKELNIDVRKIELKKNYPMIKCNINPTSKEKIYHLPFDQQYDKTIIIKNSGEFYAKDVKEAVSKGFRRAFRYMGQPTST